MEARHLMRYIVLTVPQIAFIAGTRAALGVGAGLLASSRIAEPRRRMLGLALIAFGLATTIPAARRVLGRRASLTMAG